MGAFDGCEAMNEKGWITKLRESTREFHVLPLGDLKVHRLSAACWCQPRQEYYAHTRVIHNAADGRELVEQHGVQ